MKKSKGTRRYLRIAEGRPVVDVNGQRLTAMYSETFPRELHKRNLQMAGAGVEVFMLIVRGGYKGDFATTWFWRDEVVYGDESDRPDELTLDRQAETILAAKPDAWFMVRWGSEVPADWAKRHPDHLQASGGTVRPESSYASRLALEGRAGMARQIVRHVESRPWGDRVVGYMPFGQDEGTPMIVCADALFDESPAMRSEFRAYLRRVYRTDAALQNAWNDPAATLDGAVQPTDAEWTKSRERWMHWPAPRGTRRYQDYFLAVRGMLEIQRRTEMGAVRAATSRPVFIGTDALKQPMFGWLIQDAFEGRGCGMGFRNILAGAGSIDVGGILDAPEIEALITPADYTARSNGFGFEPEGIGDSLVLRGKTIFVEDDARSWACQEKGTQGAWRSQQECRAGLMRNLAVTASRGFIPYWMNVGSGYFDNPEVLRIVAEQVPVRRRLLSRPLEHTEHAIAMIMDDSSPLDEDFTAGFQNLAVLRQRTDHLALTGLPYRIYLLSDVARDNFPKFRAYLFPNLFRLTPERAALIRDKLMRDGRMLIFGPGTGISDGRTLSAQAASDLLGFPLELVDRSSARRVLVYGGSHPALSAVDAPVTYGDSYPYGPILQPAGNLAHSGAVELGKVSAWWQSNVAGLVLKEFGRGAAGNGKAGPRGKRDYAVAFSMATPLPAAVLRSLALYAGCNPWSDLGDVVAADGRMVAVHSVRGGVRHVRLPRPASVTDAVTGKLASRRCTRFKTTLSSPDTRVFLLGD